MRPSTLFLTLALTPFLAGAVRAAEHQPEVLPLWPDIPPGEKGTNPGPEKMTGAKGSRQLTDVSQPTITVFRPHQRKNTGVAVLIAPGGGYRILAWDHEGLDVAHWLNSIGVTGVLLKYRVPSHLDLSRGDLAFPPLQDAQRAMGMIRAHAREWGIDPRRVGMLGFSAGGNLTALTASQFTKRDYEPIDHADKESARPDFAAIIYPGGVVKRGTDQIISAVKANHEFPPTFLVQASDDPVGVENSVELYKALKKAGVSVEMHLYASGGHGFGMRPGKGPTSDWPKRCEEWLREQKILLPGGED